MTTLSTLLTDIDCHLARERVACLRRYRLGVSNDPANKARYAGHLREVDTIDALTKRVQEQLAVMDAEQEVLEIAQ